MTSPALRWRVTCLGSVGVFLALAILVSSSGLLPGEQSIYETVVGWTSITGIAVFKMIRNLGSWKFLVPATLALIWLAPADARRRWWLWVAVMVLAPTVEGVGKEIIGRPRPVGPAFGFPSGHVTAAAAYFSLLAYLMNQRLKEGAFVLWSAASLAVALVGIARIAQRAHWPADVLGGAALGLAFAAAAFWWHEAHAEKRATLEASGTRGDRGSVVSPGI